MTRLRPPGGADPPRRRAIGPAPARAVADSAMTRKTATATQCRGVGRDEASAGLATWKYSKARALATAVIVRQPESPPSETTRTPSQEDHAEGHPGRDLLEQIHQEALRREQYRGDRQPQSKRRGRSGATPTTARVPASVSAPLVRRSRRVQKSHPASSRAAVTASVSSDKLTSVVAGSHERHPAA